MLIIDYSSISLHDNSTSRKNRIGTTLIYIYSGAEATTITVRELGKLICGVQLADPTSFRPG